MHRNILITRAEHQSAELVRMLTQRDSNCILLPCIEILPPTSQYSLDEAMNHVDNYDYCIFTSVNAVAALPDQLPCFKKVFAIGPATLKALQQLGIEASIPNIFSSEGLLIMPEFQQVNNKKIAIFTGENPRKLLYDTLLQRHANVDFIFCYQRSCPHYSAAALEKVMAVDIELIICSSTELLTNLVTLFEGYLTWLIRHPIVVVSDRMYQLAAELGFQEIRQAKDATTQAILNCL